MQPILFMDAEVAMLVCPRRLYIEAGEGWII